MISKDFQTAIEHVETLKKNFIRICDQYAETGHKDPLNRYAKGHYIGYIAALDAAINLIRSSAEIHEIWDRVPELKPRLDFVNNRGE